MKPIQLSLVAAVVAVLVLAITWPTGAAGYGYDDAQERMGKEEIAAIKAQQKIVREAVQSFKDGKQCKSKFLESLIVDLVLAAFDTPLAKVELAIWKNIDSYHYTASRPMAIVIAGAYAKVSAKSSGLEETLLAIDGSKDNCAIDGLLSKIDVNFIKEHQLKFAK